MKRSPSRGGFTVPTARSGSSVGFFATFGYDAELLSRDQIDEKALVNLRGVVRNELCHLNGHSYQNLNRQPTFSLGILLEGAQPIFGRESKWYM